MTAPAYCDHDLPAGTCSWCRPKAAPATVTRGQVRRQLVLILVKASQRGSGDVLSEAQAEECLDVLIANPTGPAWDAVRYGADQLRMIIRLLDQLPEDDR